MNNKQWEEDFDNLGFYELEEIEKPFYLNQEIIRLRNKVKLFISQREAEIRKEAIEDYLKSEEGKVYQDYQTMKKQAENDVRKETILAVLPYEHETGTDVGKPIDYGFNLCIETIKDKAKEKFNINL